MTGTICGVDVASKSLEARIGQHGAAGSFPNNAEGIAELGAFCRSHQAELVAMEATGGYEQQAFALLSEQGLGVAILNPRAVRQFAESMGSLEKTDRIDAGMIAWYAEVRQSRPVCLAPENQQRLVTERSVRASFTRLLAFIAGQIRDLEQRIARLIEQDPLWSELNQVFRTIKGVADRTVARLMAEMPEIAPCPTRPFPSWPGWRRWRATRASTRASARCVGAGPRCATSCSSWPVWWAATSLTSSPSSSASEPPANHPKSSASRWLTSCWCGSTLKPEKPDKG